MKYKQVDEQRTPSSWPKSEVKNNAASLRAFKKLKPYSYSILKQKPSQMYKIKFDMDRKDQANY